MRHDVSRVSAMHVIGWSLVESVAGDAPWRAINEAHHMARRIQHVGRHHDEQQ